MHPKHRTMPFAFAALLGSTLAACGGQPSDMASAPVSVVAEGSSAANAPLPVAADAQAAIPAPPSAETKPSADLRTQTPAADEHGAEPNEEASDAQAPAVEEVPADEAESPEMSVSAPEGGPQDLR